MACLHNLLTLYFIELSFSFFFFFNNEVQFIKFLMTVPLMLYLKSNSHHHGYLDFMLFSRSFKVVHFTFGSIIYLELVLVKAERSFV